MNSKEPCDKKKLIKQFNYVDKLNLFKSDAPIKEIVDSIASISITEKKIIKTCTGYQLLVKGLKKLKIRYISNDCECKMLLKKFSIPFFETFSLLPCIKITNITSEFCYCDIDIINCNSIYFYNIVNIFVIASFGKAKPVIYNSTDCDDCEKELNFKNDSYPSSKAIINPTTIYSPSKQSHCKPTKKTPCDNKEPCYYKKFICNEISLDKSRDDYLETESTYCPALEESPNS